jgi:hypothetical protein
MEVFVTTDGGATWQSMIAAEATEAYWLGPGEAVPVRGALAA